MECIQLARDKVQCRVVLNMAAERLAASQEFFSVGLYLFKNSSDNKHRTEFISDLSNGLTCDVMSGGVIDLTGGLMRSPSSHWKFEFLGAVSGVGGRTEMTGTSVGENGSAVDLLRPTVALSAVMPIKMRGPQLSSSS